MSKKKEQKDLVAEYLVKRINELEKELIKKQEELENANSDTMFFMKKAAKYEELKKLFHYENDGITKAIMIYDLDGGYNSVLAIETNKHFAKYLELLEIEEQENE